MYSKEILVKNTTGLHARPASELVKVAKKYKCSIKIVFGSKIIEPRSILSILGAGVKSGSTVNVTGDGDDEIEAVEGICSFIDELEE